MRGGGIENLLRRAVRDKFLYNLGAKGILDAGGQLAV